MSLNAWFLLSGVCYVAVIAADVVHLIRTLLV